MHWNQAAAYTRRSSVPASGVFAGPGAVAASLILGSRYLPDPQQLRGQCTAATRWLSARAVAIADEYRDRQRQHSEAPASSWAVYDTINGLAGIGRVLVVALDQGIQPARVGLDAALCTLTTMINTHNGNRPGWWLPAAAHPTTTEVHFSGSASTGAAHGIAGPLALLAVAHIAGYSVPGQEQAIRTAADWLLHWREPATDTWPPHVTGHELDHDTAAPTPRPPRRLVLRHPRHRQRAYPRRPRPQRRPLPHRRGPRPTHPRRTRPPHLGRRRTHPLPRIRRNPPSRSRTHKPGRPRRLTDHR